jgi:hypothetical protein
MAQILDVCDACVTATRAAWNTNISPSVVAAPNEVLRAYVFPHNLANDTGRKVIFFPRTFRNEAATRGEDENIYGVVCVVFERFTDAGPPTDAWVDALVLFVQNIVSDANDYVHGALMDLPGARSAWTTTNNINIYDPERLDSQKVFWSEIEFEFREII